MPPSPWRVADDREERGFVWDSVARRLYTIVLQVAEGAALPRQREALVQFANGLRDGSFVVMPVSGEDGGPDWTESVEEELSRYGTLECYLISWWFLECYAYRYMLSKVDYFNTKIDPFLAQKKQAVDVAGPDFLLVGGKTLGFRDLVLNCLWGNRSDLSVSSGHVDASLARVTSGLLLADNIAEAQRRLEKRDNGAPIVYILDNCGAELLNDLNLVQSLLVRGFRVQLHVKAHPTFVSDATAVDVDWHMAWIAERLPELAKDLIRARQESRLEIVSHDFYVSAAPFKKAPKNLVEAYGMAPLVILKGDANYRRLFGDTARPHHAALRDYGEVQGAVLTIRTCKSPIALGLEEAKVQEVAKVNPKWCLDGSTGLVQFYESTVL